MKAAQGRECVVEIGQQCSCRYLPARPESKRVHDVDPDPPPVATPTVPLPAITAAVALPMRQGAEARVQTSTMHWPPALPAAPKTLVAGAPAMHRPPAPQAATRATQAAGVPVAHRALGPPAAATRTTQAVGAPTRTPMNWSLVAHAVATPTASPPPTRGRCCGDEVGSDPC